MFEMGLVVGVVGGLLWVAFCRAIRMPRRVAIGLAPFATAAMGFGLLVAFLVLLPVVSDFEFRSLPLVLGTAVPAMLLTHFLTRRDDGPLNRKGALAGALLLAPGFLALLVGFAPHSLRYREQFRQVETLAPLIDSFQKRHHRCPTLADLPQQPALETNQLSFHCDESEYSFCIYGGFDAIGCWSSKTRDWDF